MLVNKGSSTSREVSAAPLALVASLLATRRVRGRRFFLLASQRFCFCSPINQPVLLVSRVMSSMRENRTCMYNARRDAGWKGKRSTRRQPSPVAKISLSLVLSPTRGWSCSHQLCTRINISASTSNKNTVLSQLNSSQLCKHCCEKKRARDNRHQEKAKAIMHNRTSDDNTPWAGSRCRWRRS